ncbi:MAG TPA: SDR family oxidoreductase [Steroidobacteraceae bacterium]|nr:SDR family oxidoreductase [Steroidobacteraceae bacterium]
MSDVAVITGTTHGIGRVTSLALARAGRTVVMLCRNLAAAQLVRAEIQAAVPAAQVHAVRCDLASLISVRAAAEDVRSRFPRIDLLINNAGIVSSFFRRSAEGYELTFATNHLGPFALTGLLRPQLSERARIVNVASRVHYRGKADFEAAADPQARYRAYQAYARSKLANVMFTFALARRLAAAGAGITCNCLHPGVVASNLLPHWLRLVKPLLSRVIFDEERGAQSSIHLALAPELAGRSGLYFDENQAIQAASAIANDESQQEHLWRLSERWSRIEY